MLPLEDAEGYFEHLAATARSRTDEQFGAAIEGLLVGEMYEFIGKLRNIDIGVAPAAYLPILAADIATYVAFLIGLHHRRYDSTGSKVLAEALTLPHRPTGFDQLASLVHRGAPLGPWRWRRFRFETRGVEELISQSTLVVHQVICAATESDSPLISRRAPGRMRNPAANR